MTSSIHGPEFYSQALRSNAENDNKIKSIEISNVDNFDNFNIKEIKDLYIKKGIHIYNIKEQSNYSNGYNSGRISYQIRSNLNNENFDETLKSINNQIKEKGLNIEEKQDKQIKSKHIGDCLPCNIKWNDNRIRNLTSKKSSYETKVMQPKKILNNDKISSVLIDHSYKKSVEAKKE